MPEYPSILDWDNEQTKAADRVEVPVSRLTACPDCGRGCSYQAEACPGCGRYFRSYARRLEVTPGSGWVGKVAWGIVVSSFLWGAILMGLFVIGIIIVMAFAGIGSAIGPEFYKR